MNARTQRVSFIYTEIEYSTSKIKLKKYGKAAIPNRQEAARKALAKKKRCSLAAAARTSAYHTHTLTLAQLKVIT